MYNLLLSTMFHKGQPLETFFLSLMHAIETFHRRAYGGTYMSKASYVSQFVNCSLEVSHLVWDRSSRKS